MTQEQKVIRVKVGVLELAKLGNVSQACTTLASCGALGPLPSRCDALQKVAITVKAKT